MVMLLLLLLPNLVFSIAPLFLILLIFKWLLFPTTTTNKNLPPSPSKLPILGNFHQLGLFPHRKLQALSRKHGPIMLLHYGSVPTLVLSSADAAYEVMKTNDVVFSNRPESSVAKRLLYDMKDVSVAPYGEYWRQLKSICVLQLLSNKMVQSFRLIRQEETSLVVNRIRNLSASSLPVDLSELFVSLTNDVVCRSAFGRKYCEGEKGQRILKLLREFLVLLGSLSFRDFVPWFTWVDWISGLDSRVDTVSRQLDEFLEGVVEEHMANLHIIEQGKALPDDRKEDFVDILLKIQKEKSSGISIDRDSVKAILLDIYAAGTDTTSTVLEWAMTELLRHPRVMRKVQNEVRSIVGDNQEISDEHVENMLYLNSVIKETLRFHPPIPLLVPRAAREDVKVSGYDIAAGTMVVTNAWAIGRDPESWDEPEEFLPERFLNSSVSYKGQDFQLIPFGAGRRGCPGIAFAMATNELVLANLLHKFYWELPNGQRTEDLDMAECPGVSVHRKVPLVAVATSWFC